jgi:flagellar biosynthetic protein FliR
MATGAFGPDLTAPLLDYAFAFTLITCRCGAAVMLLPGLGEAEPPLLLRIGLTLGITVLLLPLQAGHMPAMPADIAHLAGMLGAELLAGGLLGWLARLLAMALPAAGQIISLMTGLSSVLQQDQTLGAQSSAIGRLFSLAAPVLILSGGLYAMPLNALAGSYSVWPAGNLPGTDDMTQVAVAAASASFALALRLAAPFILISTIWQVALGLIARLVPQLQIYFAALPGQVLGGFLLLSLLAGAIVQAWLGAMREGYAMLPGN